VEPKADFVIIQALENGVTIMGLTRGTNTKFHHSSAIKIRGKAKVLSSVGSIIPDE
jgi:transcription attenuation protein (tryptophan RNA-binding attenuator protein)